jgi:hypothetical protein
MKSDAPRSPHTHRLLTELKPSKPKGASESTEEERRRELKILMLNQYYKDQSSSPLPPSFVVKGARAPHTTQTLRLKKGMKTALGINEDNFVESFAVDDFLDLATLRLYEYFLFLNNFHVNCYFSRPGVAVIPSCSF